MKLRSLVKQALDDGIFLNACAFADKLVTLSAGLAEDVLLLARCHVARGDHRQVSQSVTGNNHDLHPNPTRSPEPEPER